ncbi:pyridoxal phosphate-dependent deaminase, putative, partial [hydrothermal vent metagenome]
SVKIWIKRDDLNHQIVQGNKLRKLKYNLEYAIKNSYTQLVTFGGAWSNHIVATAGAARLCDLQSTGFIRGDELQNYPKKWSNTLKQAAEYNMQLIFLNRQEYRQKEHSTLVAKFIDNLPQKPYLIPEGGSNRLALKGVAKIIIELSQQIQPPTHIVTACGTAATMAGLIDGVAKMKWQTKIIGISVLKGASFLRQNIHKLASSHQQVNWQLYSNYHFGGYAKVTENLIQFGKKFVNNTNVNLDKIYTAKSFYAVYDLISAGKITAGSNVVILHTGGLQGGLITDI